MDVSQFDPAIIDTEAGLRMAAGNKPLYIKLLRDYHTHYHGASEAIEAAIAAGNLEEARRLVHSLKNISGMTGAQRVRQAAIAAEKSLAGGETPDLEELGAALTEAMTLLAGMTAAEAPVSGAGAERREPMDSKDTKEKFSIMIADDDKVNLDVLSSILMNEYDLRVFKTGKALLDQALENPPDLILLDVMMPGMTGFQVLTKLKEAETTRRIPVIFLTGLDGEGYEEKGLKLGAVDYISKPFSHAIVLARIRSQVQIISYIREIERLGMIDALTDIPNRRNFDLRVQEEWRRQCRNNGTLTMMKLDVDRFKDYNETYGRSQGDVLLRHLAAIITKTLRRSADFAARIGGEEFAVLLPGTSLEGAAAIAEKIREAVKAQPAFCAAQNRNTETTISIGVVSMTPTKRGAAEELLNLADVRLCAAKEAGRDRVVYR